MISLLCGLTSQSFISSNIVNIKTTGFFDLFLSPFLHIHFPPLQRQYLCIWSLSSSHRRHRTNYDCLAWMFIVVIIEIWTTLKCIVHIYTCLCNSCWSLRSLPIIHFFLDISLECTCPFLHGMINILSKLPTYLKYIKILCIKHIENLRVVFLF